MLHEFKVKVTLDAQFGKRCLDVVRQVSAEELAFAPSEVRQQLTDALLSAEWDRERADVAIGRRRARETGDKR